MLQGIQINVTLGIDFVVLADALGISRDECIGLWDKGILEERISVKLSLDEVVNLCDNQDAYGYVKVGSAYF